MSRKHDPLYFVWYNMFRYCRSNKYYAGVSVCDEWRSRAAFEAWAAAHGWRRGLMLARRDKTAADALISRVVRGFGDYTTDPAVYRAARRDLLAAVSTSGTSK